MKLQDYYNKCILCNSSIEIDKGHNCIFRLDKKYRLKSYLCYTGTNYFVDKHRTSKFVYRIVVSRFYNPKEFHIYKYNAPHLETIVGYKDFDLEFKDIYELINYSDKIINSHYRNQIFI